MSSFLKEGDCEVVEDLKNPSALRASPFKNGDKNNIYILLSQQMTEVKFQ
jgi:hypothetical protein